ncbi:MAG: ferritin-like domain-containing protein [Rhodospirillales bacterium]
MASLYEGALAVLMTAEADVKARATRSLAEQRWNGLELGSAVRPPDRPARPDRPQLLAPAAMPKRSKAGEKGRAALVHAIQHIELNAIDLALDMAVRFGPERGPDEAAFVDDWLNVADDEARHYQMLGERLADFGLVYGDLPAHDGLWQAALTTRGDVLARLAFVPLVLEARGLDTTPAAVNRLRGHGDRQTAAIFETIAAEEVAHVAAGQRWFTRIARQAGLEPVAHFRHLAEMVFPGVIRGPFNVEARGQAGLSPAFYQPN